MATGFVLLDAVGLTGTSLMLSLLGYAMAASLAFATRPAPKLRRGLAALAFGLAALTVTFHRPLHEGLFERLQFKNEFAQFPRFSALVENRTGVITVADDAVIFGGGIYDGRFNISPINDENTITRIYALSLFHPAPGDVFGVGLSGGSWAQVLANHPEVRSLEMAEINPGYSSLIREHALVSSLMRNPKFTLSIDDGRRYLARTTRRFDVIVSNTTYHWRASASNLLSVEFLELARQHLTPGGVMMYNSTRSSDVYHTACSVFPHVARVFNFVVASDRKFDIDKQRWRAVLERYIIDGKPVFDPNDRVALERLSEIVALADGLELADGSNSFMESGASLCPRVAGARLITDDNMGTEWLNAVANAFVLGCQDAGSCTP